MARKHEAEKLLRDGLSPSQIAQRMSISVNSVLQYLRTRVGDGSLKLSDIFFAIPRDTRDVFDKAMSGGHGQRKINLRKLPRGDYCREELDLYVELSQSSRFSGDMYEHIGSIEILLHDFVRNALVTTLGRSEDEWWRQGVPLPVRKDCQARREEDDDRVDDPFAYTTSINLKSILDKNWSTFDDLLPKRWVQNKKEFLSAIDRLNGIRNAVMHPVKKRTWTDDDFEFVRDFHNVCTRLSQPSRP